MLLIFLTITSCDLFSTLFKNDPLSEITRDNAYDPGAANFMGVRMLSPVDRAKLNASPTLVWGVKQNAAAYHLIFDDNADFSSPLIDDNALTSDRYYIDFFLADGQNYYWKMCYKNSTDDWSIWNSPWCFAMDFTSSSLLWSFTTGGTIHTSPAIGLDGTIYVAASDNRLYAINPDGSEKWNFTACGRILSSPVIASDGTIYIVSYEANLYAINPNGTEKWLFALGDFSSITEQFYVSPALEADGTIYIGCKEFDWMFYAVNPDGTEKWKVQRGNHFWTSTIAGDGTIYTGYWDSLISVAPANGNVNWEYVAGDGIGGAPSIGADGTIYVGTGTGLMAVRPNGTELWVYVTNSKINTAPAIAANGTIYFGGDDDTLYAVSSGSPGLQASPWPTYQKNNQNTGRY